MLAAQMQLQTMGKKEAIRLLALNLRRVAAGAVEHLRQAQIPLASQADLAAAQEDREPQHLAVLARQVKATMVAQTLAMAVGLAVVVAQAKQAKIGKALGRATAAMALLLRQSDGIALLRSAHLALLAVAVVVAAVAAAFLVAREASAVAAPGAAPLAQQSTATGRMASSILAAAAAAPIIQQLLPQTR